MSVVLYSAKEIKKVVESGRIAYDTHMHLASYIQPGVSLGELDLIANKFIASKGGRPAFLGYQNYPASICASVNDVVVHGLPDKSVHLQEGDIVGIDLGVDLDGYYSDTAWTWPVGEISQEAKKLISVTQKCLFLGIKNAIAGNRIGNISYAVQKHAESNGYSVVRTLVGHGIGRSLHEEPQVPNFGRKKDGPRIKNGMIIAIEPMINIGAYDITTDDDTWTVRSSDGSLSAHFEHTLAITSNGPIICTLPQGATINVFEIMQKTIPAPAKVPACTGPATPAVNGNVVASEPVKVPACTGNVVTSEPVRVKKK